MTWLWPVPYSLRQVPRGDHDGAFGKKRRYDMHTGVDLYCNPGDDVIAVEDGVCVGLEEFTGPNAGSPWWRQTWAVKIYGDSGVVLYGEVLPNENIRRGARVAAGDILGTAMRVRRYRLKNLFNWRSHTMLHLELYVPGPGFAAEKTMAVWWRHDELKPAALTDPTQPLVDAYWATSDMSHLWTARGDKRGA
jgi:hypothetical protein